MHLRRSKYTLDKAIIAWRADFDASKMAFLTRTCKQLRHLEMPDSSVTGDSLISALPLAQNLSTLIIGGGCLTSVKVILQTLTICQKTLVMAVFANVQGSLDPKETWPMLESLEHLDLRVIESPRHSFNLVCPNPPSCNKYIPDFNKRLTCEKERSLGGRAEYQETDLGLSLIHI